MPTTAPTPTAGRRQQHQARLFLALLPGPAQQPALAAHRDQWLWHGDEAVYATADWHITLHFLGPVPRSRLAELVQALHLPMAPCVLEFGTAQIWRKDLAVLCPLSVPDALLQLHLDLGMKLQDLGLPVESRTYRPHVTLARHAGNAIAPAQPASFSWPVTAYALMESTGDTLRRYRVLAHFHAN